MNNSSAIFMYIVAEHFIVKACTKYGVGVQQVTGTGPTLGGGKPNVQGISVDTVAARHRCTPI